MVKAKSNHQSVKLFYAARGRFRLSYVDKVHPVTSHDGSEGEYLFLAMVLDMGGWSGARPDRFTPRERDPVPILQEAGWASGPMWSGLALDRV